MINFFDLSKSARLRWPQLTLAISLLLMSSNTVSANSDNKPISDLLIVLDSDGRSHTVQHTVSTNNTALAINLPASVIPLEVMFLGANSEQQTTQFEANPSRLQLDSGSAFVRYQHQYGSELTHTLNGHYVLTTQSTPSNVMVDNAQTIGSSIMWVFPSEFEILTYSIAKPETGRWTSGNNTLSFQQLGTEVVDLSITYKRHNTLINQNTNGCADFNKASDHCSTDEDADGIPDYRDICLYKHEGASTELGCKQAPTTVLTDVVFKQGRTYLDTEARKTLDRVAHALKKLSDKKFMIGAHTDNSGGQKINQTLSQKRADAVRHYLMLRGVGPNQVTSVGYGEQYPIRDNATKAGRMANRRVEISAVN